jgi:flagellar motor switch protein FliN/FliY
MQESAPHPALVAPQAQAELEPISPVQDAGPSLADEIEARIADAPLLFEVRLPMRNLRVKDILALEKGKVYETEWPADEDLPAGCGGVQLVWTEFEVIEKKLAVRVTRLA